MNNTDRKLITNALARTRPRNLDMRTRADQELYRVWNNVVVELGALLYGIHPAEANHPFYDACNEPPPK